MSKHMALNVRVAGELSDFVAANVGADGSYDNASEYVRDLIRRDKERAETLAVERLKAELTRAFATPDAAYLTLSADDVIERARQRRKA